MGFEMKPYQEDLVAELQEVRKQQKEVFEAACAILRENLEKYPESDNFGQPVYFERPVSSLTKEELELMNKQIALRRISKEEFLKEVSKTPKEYSSTVIVVGSSQHSKGMLTARLIESLKDHNHQVILVDGGDSSKLYGKEADQMVIDSLTELGNERFNEKMLRALSPQLDSVEPYKKRKKGRNKSSFPGSGLY